MNEIEDRVEQEEGIAQIKGKLIDIALQGREVADNVKQTKLQRMLKEVKKRNQKQMWYSNHKKGAYGCHVNSKFKIDDSMDEPEKTDEIDWIEL